MRYISFALLALLMAAFGCKDQPQCAGADTPAVCKAVQECFASGTFVVVCREAERDINRPNTSLVPATRGAADALSYDASRALQKPIPKHAQY